jgi:hypothetical protein
MSDTAFGITAAADAARSGNCTSHCWKLYITLLLPPLLGSVNRSLSAQIVQCCQNLHAATLLWPLHVCNLLLPGLPLCISPKSCM